METELSILPGVDAPHVYVRAWALGCFQSYEYPSLSEGADRVGGQLRGDKECPFSGVTKSGRAWRKVPESDARSVPHTHTQTHARTPEVSHKKETAWGFQPQKCVFSAIEILM